MTTTDIKPITPYPYGEWFESGYNNDASGENLHYSNDLIKSKCSPEGENYLWLHRITKK
jgi:hypothetical protein